MSVFGFLLTSRIARALSPIDAVGSLSNNRFIHTHTLSLSLSLFRDDGFAVRSGCSVFLFIEVLARAVSG